MPLPKRKRFVISSDFSHPYVPNGHPREARDMTRGIMVVLVAASAMVRLFA